MGYSLLLLPNQTQYFLFSLGLFGAESLNPKESLISAATFVVDNISKAALLSRDGLLWLSASLWDGLLWLSASLWDGLLWLTASLWDGLLWLSASLWDGLLWLSASLWDGLLWLSSSLWDVILRISGLVGAFLRSGAGFSDKVDGVFSGVTEASFAACSWIWGALTNSVSWISEKLALLFDGGGSSIGAGASWFGER